MTNYFISGSHPQLDKLPTRAKKLYKVKEIVTFKSARFGVFSTEIGFVTDLASIPWFIPIPQASDTNGPAVVHDTRYALQDCSREVADILFYEAMIANGVSEVKARAFYLAVATFGWYAWNKAKKQKEENQKNQLVNY